MVHKPKAYADLTACSVELSMVLVQYVGVQGVCNRTVWISKLKTRPCMDECFKEKSYGLCNNPTTVRTPHLTKFCNLECERKETQPEPTRTPKKHDTIASGIVAHHLLQLIEERNVRLYVLRVRGVGKNAKDLPTES